MDASASISGKLSMNHFQQFIFSYFVSATALAGLAVLWRNWLADHPNWTAAIKKIFGPLNKALTCGSCFTFWIALAFVLIFNPLESFLTALLPAEILFFKISAYLIQWFSLGWTALFLRFSYVAIQEHVSRTVHQDGHQH